MSLPAGWLATKLGYKRGIIAGLLIVALGGLWFLPATSINGMVHTGGVSPTTAFIAYLAGVCAIATGLTFLETIANPYTTVLGPKQYAAFRINVAQSCNGVGWIFGPIIGSVYFYSKDAAGRSTGNETLYIPYVTVAVAAILIAAIFYFANVPEIKTEDTYHLDAPGEGAAHSIWSHPHFVMAVAAQFFYVAAQAGIFSFFINYMTAETPAIPASWASGSFANWFETGKTGLLQLSDSGAAKLASVAFGFFLAGRVTGAALLKKFSAHKVLGLYGAINVLVCLMVFFKLGWLSVACVFLSYFFMSIMFPTIFALGIFGLGQRAKKASAFIVMAIMGGAVLPKLMGAVADAYDMSRGFIVPLVCFVFVAFYGLQWPKLSKAESLSGMKIAGGH
jgi:FHS family L-fucose permease-like MFS transporter